MTTSFQLTRATSLSAVIIALLALIFAPAVAAAPSVPPGYEAQVFAEGPGLSFVTSLAFDGDGVLHVGVANIFTGTGQVLRLEDDDADGEADSISVYASGFGLVTGITFRGARSRRTDPGASTDLERIRSGASRGRSLDLYVSHFVPGQSLSGKVTIVTDRDRDGVAEERLDVVTGLPSEGVSGNQQLAFGPNGRVYFAQGGRTNNGVPVSGPPDTPLNGTILRMNPDGTDLTVHARGLRNAFDLVFMPDGELLATENGPDASGPAPVVGAPDELNSIVECGDYGWPQHHGFPPEDSGTLGPVALFDPGTSTDGLALVPPGTFPGLAGDLIAAQFGSFTDPAIGRKLVRIRLVGRRAALVETFATDFGRPLDVAFAPDGSLYVADFSSAFFTPGSSVIHRIHALPPADPAPPASATSANSLATLCGG